jgi:hypothetical protein
MDPQRMRELASAGGKAAINRHKFTSEEARAAREKRTRVEQERRQKNLMGVPQEPRQP